MEDNDVLEVFKRGRSSEDALGNAMYAFSREEVKIIRKRLKLADKVTGEPSDAIQDRGDTEEEDRRHALGAFNNMCKLWTESPLKVTIDQHAQNTIRKALIKQAQKEIEDD
jgi:hypothetical protein